MRKTYADERVHAKGCSVFCPQNSHPRSLYTDTSKANGMSFQNVQPLSARGSLLNTHVTIQYSNIRTGGYRKAPRYGKNSNFQPKTETKVEIESGPVSVSKLWKPLAFTAAIRIIWYLYATAYFRCDVATLTNPAGWQMWSSQGLVPVWWAGRFHSAPRLPVLCGNMTMTLSVSEQNVNSALLVLWELPFGSMKIYWLAENISGIGMKNNLQDQENMCVVLANGTVHVQPLCTTPPILQHVCPAQFLLSVPLPPLQISNMLPTLQALGTMSDSFSPGGYPTRLRAYKLHRPQARPSAFDEARSRIADQSIPTPTRPEDESFFRISSNLPQHYTSARDPEKFFIFKYAPAATYYVRRRPVNQTTKEHARNCGGSISGDSFRARTDKSLLGYTINLPVSVHRVDYRTVCPIPHGRSGGKFREPYLPHSALRLWIVLPRPMQERQVERDHAAKLRQQAVTPASVLLRHRPILLCLSQTYSEYNLKKQGKCQHVALYGACASLGKEQFVALYLAGGMLASMSSYLHKCITAKPGLSLGACGATSSGSEDYVCLNCSDASNMFSCLPKRSSESNNTVEKMNFNIGLKNYALKVTLVGDEAVGQEELSFKLPENMDSSVKSMVEVLCGQIDELTNEVRDLKEDNALLWSMFEIVGVSRLPPKKYSEVALNVHVSASSSEIKTQNKVPYGTSTLRTKNFLKIMEQQEKSTQLTTDEEGFVTVRRHGTKVFAESGSPISKPAVASKQVQLGVRYNVDIKIVPKILKSHMNAIFFTRFAADVQKMILCRINQELKVSNPKWQNLTMAIFLIWCFGWLAGCLISPVYSRLQNEQRLGATSILKSPTGQNDNQSTVINSDSAGGVKTVTTWEMFRQIESPFTVLLFQSGAIMTILAYVCSRYPDLKLSIVFLPFVTFSADSNAAQRDCALYRRLLPAYGHVRSINVSC
ncbi:hypothetical protein PR048_028087 [Dryococelus australis]|uniref:Uncharacterized protein n=1 Tax=Dryococelus australis TaxID=614101 RepID=A0ABQ9GI99_9NEOP|nr:hypothetical protein PR048_028087 [Dryococelus australis]